MDNQQKTLYEALHDSPMFQLSLASKELFHSNFLAWIGSWNYGDRDKRGVEHPFRKLMTALGAEHVNDWPDETWYVAREFRNFDLCVLNRMPDEFQDDSDQEEDIRILLVLENKVKSIPNIEQLQEYQDKVLDINFEIVKDNCLKYKWQLSDKEGTVKEEKNRGKKFHYTDKREYASEMKKAALSRMKDHVAFVLLSMSKEFPDLEQINNEKIWKVVDYQAYIDNIRHICLDKTDYDFLLSDYCDQMEILLRLHKKWTNNIEDNKFLISTDSGDYDYKELKKLRIHDLCQKQRYAMMCANLKNRFAEILKSYKIKCVPKMDLRKPNDGFENKALISFNYLHGEPLLDIWLGTKDYVYTIQVQGDKYEHGIQQMVNPKGDKEKGVNSRTLWNDIWNKKEDSVSNWNWICPFENPFTKEGKIQKDGFFPIIDIQNIIFDYDVVYPDKPRKRNKEYFPFLKYELDNGITFIYQYRKISEKATVNNVLDYIVADYEALCKMILGKP